MSLPIRWAERGLLPDLLIRFGIRGLLAQRLRQEVPAGETEMEARVTSFVHFLSESPIAVETQAANAQHYEVPPPFFETVLGPRLKYSSCLWEEGVTDLAEAEIRMLQTTAERADVGPGQRILDLGCGWGSFSLWAAEKFPESTFVAVSNSAPQREFILARTRERGIANLTVVTCDMNRFSTEDRFDRIVSIEMLEHLRNYRAFFSKVREWLKPDGRFFVHIFCHRSVPYAFESEGESDWMARHFFTGGIMPCFDLFERFDSDLQVVEKWRVSGLHYSKTLEAWLERHDRGREGILKLFSECYAPDTPTLWFRRWRIFFMACSELFAYRGGEEWFVGHYLLRPK